MVALGASAVLGAHLFWSICGGVGSHSEYTVESLTVAVGHQVFVSGQVYRSTPLIYRDRRWVE